MLETLRLWLNGSREYFTGVAIFSQLSKEEKLLQLFKKGNTPFNVERLYKELLSICNDLKAAAADIPVQSPITSQITPPAATEPVNTALYDAAKKDADNKYKEAMNKRAELFAMCKVEEWEEVNQPDRVQKRSPLAIEVVKLYNQASKLYDRADFVKIHGRLPNDEAPTAPAGELYQDLPDELIFQTLSNRRKAYNKLKAKDTNSDRVVLLQEHEAAIKILEEKWHLLKQRK